MAQDRFGRDITYLRISVTDRCNFRCRYCMPAQGVRLKAHGDILRYEEIIRIAAAAIGLGVRKIRLTGGEPLVKRDIETLVAGLSSLRGLQELCMTTNGSLLTPPKAAALKEAGLGRVNISLDTLDPGRFAYLTRGGRLDTVLRGIDAALDAGLTPVKINLVVMQSTEEREVEAMRAFCDRKGLSLQTINHFSLDHRPEAHYTYDRPTPCEACNRIRITADGFVKPCLFSENEIKIDLDDIEGSLLAAVSAKPRAGRVCGNRVMSQIGG